MLHGRMFAFAPADDLADAEVGYCGPVDTYDRYMAGEVVTRTDCLTDLSEMVVRPMDLRDQNRLRWMLANLETVAGEPRRPLNIHKTRHIHRRCEY